MNVNIGYLLDRIDAISYGERVFGWSWATGVAFVGKKAILGC